MNVISFHYPEAHVFQDIRLLQLSDLLPIASTTPDVSLVLHVGGSPCPGFCRWDPFREGKAGESESLLLELRRTSRLLAEAWPVAQIDELRDLL